MSTICRLCLQKDDSISKVNIFDLSLSDTLYWIFGVEIDVGDSYSKLICSKCLYNVKYVLRMQKQFQTNQYILKERVCPVDFDVETASGTRDIGTWTEYQPSDDRLTISFDTLAKLNRPFVPIEKFEESEIYNDYTKICKHSYRQKGRMEKAEPDGAKAERISVPIDIFSTFPSLEISKLENTYGYEGYEKINDYLYKELPKQTQTSAEEVCRKDMAEYFETHELPNNVQVTTEDRSQEDESKMDDETHDSKCDMISVPMSIFNLFNSPYVDVPRLDNTLYEKGYKKVDEFVYREMPTKLRVRRPKKCKIRNRLHYKNYYYNLPTSALKELMMERQQVINGEKSLAVPKNSTDKNASISDINEEVSVEAVCKHCSQNFKNKELLNLHCSVKHNKEKVFTKIIRRRKKKVLNVDPPSLLISQNEKKCRMKMPGARKVVSRMHFKKIKKLPSLFEKMNLGIKVRSESKEHLKKKWMASKHLTSGNITVSENCFTSKNCEKTSTKNNSQHSVPTETPTSKNCEETSAKNNYKHSIPTETSTSKNCEATSSKNNYQHSIPTETPTSKNCEETSAKNNYKHSIPTETSTSKNCEASSKNNYQHSIPTETPTSKNCEETSAKNNYKHSINTETSTSENCETASSKNNYQHSIPTETSTSKNFKETSTKNNSQHSIRIETSTSEDCEETSTRNNSEHTIPTETYVYQQQEVIWFPEVIGSDAPYDQDNSDSFTSDDETSDRCVDKESKDDYVISLKNKLSSRLKANSENCTTSAVKEPLDKKKRSSRLKANSQGCTTSSVKKPLDKKTADFIKQRLSDVKKTREKICSLKKLLDALRDDIVYGTFYDERCVSIMNLLSGNNTA